MTCARWRSLAIPKGVRIAFKGVSWSRTASNFALAGEFVLLANCRNLGLAIDAFDIIGAQIPLEDLDAIDPEQIFVVQLSDFKWQSVPSIAENAATKTRFRVFPGEGAHSDDLAAFVSRLDTLGYSGVYSFDVYNDDYQQMPPDAVVAGRGALPNGSRKRCCESRCRCPTSSTRGIRIRIDCLPSAASPKPLFRANSRILMSVH